MMNTFAALTLIAYQGAAFVPSQRSSSLYRQNVPLFAITTEQQVKSDVDRLKKVLEREYVSFFSPMEAEYYTNDVTFKDPLNDLSGVEAYENNVNM